MLPGRSSTPAAPGEHGTTAEMVQPGGNRRAEPPEGQGRADRGQAPAGWLAAYGAALLLDVLFDDLLGWDRAARGCRLFRGLPFGLGAIHHGLPLGGQPLRVRS